MEYKKTYIYLQNSFTLFFTETIDQLKTRTNSTIETFRKFRIAARLTARIIKSGFKFYFAYPSEEKERNRCYKQFCDELFKTLKKGL